LIGQLGDDDFHVRQAATEKLKAMGKAAVPALQEARKSPDSEIHSRADQILQEIDRPPALPLPKPTGANGAHSTRMSFGGGEKTIDVSDPGRTIHIEETAAGIVMKVTGKIDGKEVTRDFKVKNADELKKQNPEAYALYQQYANNTVGLGQIQIRGAGGVVIHGNINIQGGGVLINPNGIQQLPPAIIKPLVPVNPPGDDLEKLESRILEQMKASNIPDDQQKQVKDLFKQMRDALPQDKPDKDVNAQMRDYNHQSDALRQKLADLKLPDPGNALPPPASGRLGITATEEPVAGQGLIVTHVLPDSRAEKMGLKEQDVIQKVNGQEIHSTAELRKLVTDNPKSLVIECLRDGKPLKLQEPAAAGAGAKWYK
jgi:hypothetical protein